MPSPFPGMDPYVEAAIWRDFHLNLLSAMRAGLNAVLPERYIALTEQNVWVQATGGEDPRLLGSPDVEVADRGRAGNGAAVATASSETAVAPLLIRWPKLRQRTHRYLQIVDSADNRVVTVIEILSPSNKTTGADGENYRAKRLQYLAGRVNLVEIDLLRAGERAPLGEPPPPASDYYLLVSRADSFPEAELWPLSVRDVLPRVPVPLDPQAREATLDLRACIDRVYDEGRYHHSIDYTRPLTPPLTEPDATWARELLADRDRPVVS